MYTFIVGSSRAKLPTPPGPISLKDFRIICWPGVLSLLVEVHGTYGYTRNVDQNMDNFLRPRKYALLGDDVATENSLDD